MTKTKTKTNAVAVAEQAARRRGSVGTLMAGAVLASAVGIAAAESFKLPVDTASPGLMVRHRKGRIHTDVRRGDGPSVVFESGLGTPLTAWSWVAQELPEEVPVLAYDRPGIGWSHAAPREWRRFYPLDLYELCGVLNMQPPLILVGHSLGGLLIRIFAEQHPELVGGLVFIDPSHPRQYERSQAARQGLLNTREQLDRLLVRSALRLPAPSSWMASMRGLPAHLVAPTAKVTARFAALRAARHELDLSESSWAEGAALLTSTPHPVAVVTSAAVHKADPDYARLVEEIAGLSGTSRVEMVEEADHMSLLCDRGHAARVAEAIQWVVDKCPRPPSADQDLTPFTAAEATP